MGASLDFRILGPLEVHTGGHALPLGGARGAKALATLLLAANQTVPLGRLVRVVWDGEPPLTAREQVQNCLSGLRRRLVAAGLPPLALQSGLGGYRLTFDEYATDIGRFRVHLADGRVKAAAGDLIGAVTDLETAIGLWRGPALAGVDSAALAAEVQHLEDLRMSVRLELARLRLAVGQFELAALELGALCAEYPLNEQTYALRMRALHAAGRRAEALEVFRTARETMRTELGLDPGPELRELERAVLVESSSGGPGGWTSPASALLTATVPDFTGRAALVDRLSAILAARSPHPAPVLAGITGMAGVGKSTTAIHIGHSIAAAFPDGQWYANLRGADPSDVLAALLRSSGVPGSAMPTSLDERAAAYRDRVARRRLLIVLDNAVSETQVRPLLPGSGSCAVLITSRGQLAGIEGVQWVDLDVFTRTEAIEFIGRMGGGLPDSERPHAAEIARLCDYLPLAIRIVGARLRARPTWRLAEFAETLRNPTRRLDNLVAGDLDVRSSINLSYQDLPPGPKRLLRTIARLGTYQMDADLLGAEPAGQWLEQLVDARLLEAGGVDEVGRRRYHCRPLVQLFARELA